MKARFLRAAQAELQETVDYYNAQRPSLGDRFASEVAVAIQRIKFWPNASTRVSRRARMCKVKRFPYLVIYVPRESEILIVSVMHGRRRPGYWKQRLKDLGP